MPLTTKCCWYETNKSQKSDYREEIRVEVGKACAVCLGDCLQHASHVFHIIKIDDGVVYRTDDFHGVILEKLATAQLGHRLVIFQHPEHRLYVAVSLEQSAAEPHTRLLSQCGNYNNINATKIIIVKKSINSSIPPPTTVVEALRFQVARPSVHAWIRPYASISLWTWYFINRLGKFRRIYNFCEFVDEDKLMKFWGEKSRSQLDWIWSKGECIRTDELPSNFV